MPTSRRNFLMLAGAGAAAAPLPAWAAGPPWQTQWAELTAAAKREGTDVALVDPTAVARPGQWYLLVKDPSLIPEVEKTRALMSKITGQPA
jgi:hypothetical protein